ncbi:glutamine amidotransferase [Kouleothrix aurantiaca]|jgi:CobQ-like glutamine amidotransferase family enzyme|uniref:Lipid II isoglutaminyl synthase (glutamine-hydrolyzing) subunit GatD n=1 Tax=Kouleothrix aurantiaca TaxID=186479 RepID=A0A0P9EZX1_9CHLR|nr:glutamine amidotransferase [Kouleothrix aurantiaca]
MSYRLRLAHLYPDQMNIYGDRGNILTLTQRCAWRGIELELVPVGVGAAIDWPSIDMAFFGGGQDSGQALIADDFVRHQGPQLREAIEDNLVLLSICGGYQLLGHYFLTHTGERLPGVGAIDVHTVGGSVRLIGNIVVEAGDWPGAAGTLAPGTRLVGFENHSGRTYLGAGVRPMGRVLAGHGNNGEDGTEGAVYRNTFGCYMHGSLLPKNPQFADYLIGLALQRRYGAGATLAPLDDGLELVAQRTMVDRLVHG